MTPARARVASGIPGSRPHGVSIPPTTTHGEDALVDLDNPIQES